jgi:hypothetical protein
MEGVQMTRPTPAAIRAAAEMAAKLGVTIRLEGETVTVMPKPEDRADDFDRVRRTMNMLAVWFVGTVKH